MYSIICSVSAGHMSVITEERHTDISAVTKISCMRQRGTDYVHVLMNAASSMCGVGLHFEL